MQVFTSVNVFKSSFVAAFMMLAASISFYTNDVQADWVSTVNGYECVSGTCALSCTAANECENETFVASRTAVSASVTCIGENSCLNAEFYLAANANNVGCAGTSSCNGAQINVGVPDSGVIVAPVPTTFSQSDFFGLINSFSLSCLVDSACVGTSVVSYYEINDQTIFCVGDTNACQNLSVDAYSTVGDVSIACETATSCNAVTFTTAAVTSGCTGDSCSEVNHTQNAVPSPDVDGDGTLDENDLCPTGSSTITDVSPVDGCDDGIEVPDSDNDGVPDVLDGKTLEWAGPIFFGDFFDEGNWEDDGVDAAPDVINPSQVIGREIVMSNVALSIPDDTNIFLGQGNSLTFSGGTLGAGVNTQFHPLSVGGGGSASIVVKSTSNFNIGLSWDIAWRVEGSSRLISANTDFSSDTGVFGKSSSVDFVGGKTRVILSAISVSNAQTMIGKFTVDSAAAVLDSNLIIKSDGASGSVVLPDFDGDGFGGHEDNCPFTESLDADVDSDGCDDATEDTDDDNDGVADGFDMCVTADFSLSVDFDTDGCDDADEDVDDDNDGKLDTGDSCLTEDAILSVDVDNDGCDDADEDKDDDNDGVLDTVDQCVTEDFNLSADNDNDGCDDADEDKDDDNDGVLDTEDAFPNDPAKFKKSSGSGGGSLFYLLGLGAWVLVRRLGLQSTP